MGSRLTMTARALLLAMLAAASLSAQAAERVEVFKNQYCGCCGKWIEHMRAAGFDVVAKDVDDVSVVRHNAGIDDRYGSCHTARVGGYALEGHVPAADVKRLLKEKPQAVGLAVPGMPQSAPGMDGAAQPYTTLLVQRGGTATVFARH